jgi:hypothetical protein
MKIIERYIKLNEFNFKLNNISIKYSISKILFIIFKKDNIKNDTFYFTLLEFSMININSNGKIKIIYKKKNTIRLCF